MNRTAGNLFSFSIKERPLRVYAHSCNTIYTLQHSLKITLNIILAYWMLRGEFVR